MMRYQIEPMPTWPYPATPHPRASPFRVKWADTLDLLSRELAHLGVQGAVALRVVATDADVRRDGMLRSNAKVRYHGVALAFRSKHGPLSYPCDTFANSWQDNVRAIALALHALRTVDRYGVSSRGEQYAGWRAIEGARPAAPFSTKREALDWLREFTGAVHPLQLTDSDIRGLLRIAARKSHPDLGGDPADWARLDTARQLLRGGDAT
ncbi:hypothetical protein [Amycolatopsis methanolica]|uniref:Heat shock protein DnaJ domain-containing protein n=1 Tax=Amycolatopsis methanolica 239 TaxID=1068978 RepID=A0A076N555_AMYME|nr:hypothetical protein [Amycolatopsis methanolica]AIJ26387.1 heat shock protein DnaJ domain-containing protein [Amycolatopsis methanolica 239]AIJ26446.1 heat shock protein DnaJ domain-containing protein [Amycolatopsis methanolica 239]